MLVKRFLVTVIAVLLLILSAAYEWANCHTSPQCENLLDHMVTLEKWILSDNNHVKYYLNSQAGYPGLGTDCQHAASQWS